MNKDMIRKIALELDDEDLNSFCKAFTKFKEVVCNSEIFWMNKLNKDFPNINTQDVVEFEKLYRYLRKRPKRNYVDLDDYFENIENLDPYKFIEDIQDNLVEDYDLEEGDIVIFEDLFQTAIWDGKQFQIDYGDDYFEVRPPLTFPKFPPEFWDSLDTASVIPSDIFEKGVENIFNEQSYITGKFNEKYPINYTNDMKNYVERILANKTDYNYVYFDNYRVEI